MRKVLLILSATAALIAAVVWSASGYAPILLFVGDTHPALHLFRTTDWRGGPFYAVVSVKDGYLEFKYAHEIAAKATVRTIGRHVGSFKFVQSTEMRETNCPDLLIASHIFEGLAQGRQDRMLARKVSGPMWALVAIFGAYPSVLFAVFAHGVVRSLCRRKKGLCTKCGYDLTGNTSGVCPECGAPI